MTRKDFSRKPNTFAPVLINDGYSNFRFSKRAGEILSPLNKSKFGFNLNRSKMRKTTINPQYRSDLRKHLAISEMNQTSYAKFGQNNSLCDKSQDSRQVLPHTQQNF